MHPRRLRSLSLAVALCALGCADDGPRPTTAAAPTADGAEAARILAVLNAETRAALGRDYDGWRGHWVHGPHVAKTYIDLEGGTASEMLGWDEVDAFVRTYIEAHPEPEPPPRPLTEADVRLYGDGAWVSYEQDDADQGRKRETRLMERVDGVWKIAGMHTTVYGSAEAE